MAMVLKLFCALYFRRYRKKWGQIVNLIPMAEIDMATRLEGLATSQGSANIPCSTHIIPMQRYEHAHIQYASLLVQVGFEGSGPSWLFMNDPLLTGS